MGIDRGWRRKLVHALNLPGEGGTEVLDLATGTADVAMDILRAFTESRVTGVDPSVEMMHIGDQKVGAAGFRDRMHFVKGSAEALPFSDNTFSAACISFGIRNVPNRHLGLSEMTRVVRPGGHVAVLELSEPRGGLMSTLARIHVHHVVPWLGAMLSGSKEYRYLQQSIAAFPRPEEFKGMMETAGLVNVQFTPLTFGTCVLYAGQVPEKG